MGLSEVERHLHTLGFADIVFSPRDEYAIRLACLVQDGHTGTPFLCEALVRQSIALATMTDCIFLRQPWALEPDSVRFDRAEHTALRP